MSTLPVIGSKGLHPSANPLTSPGGSQDIAENCVVTSRDVLEPRRGQALKAYGFGSSDSRSDAGGFFGETEIIHGASVNVLTYDNGASYTDYSGTYAPVDDAQQRMKFIEAAVSLYINTGAGVYVLDSVAGTPVLAGVQRAQDILYYAYNELSGNPDAGWMPTDSQVAYRVAWGIIDANGRVKIGAPSGRHVVTNPADVTVEIGNLTRVGTAVDATSTPHGFPEGPFLVAISPGEANFPAGNVTITTTASTSAFSYTEAGAAVANTVAQVFSSGAKNVLLRVPIPSGLTTSNFLRVYRSWTSETALLEPTDELYLVMEVAITAADIAAGYKDVTDVTPEGILSSGAPLHTNADTADGPLQANDRAPLCRDMCEWDDRVWFVNTTHKHRFHLSLLGVGTPDGVQVNDTITIAGRLYVAITVPIAGSMEFYISTALTSAQAISETARNLVALINADTESTVYAWYESAGSDLPGKILLEERTIGGAAFHVAASRPASWGPALPVPVAVTEASCTRSTSAVVIAATSHGLLAGGAFYLASNAPDANWPVGAKTVYQVSNPNQFSYLEDGTEDADGPAGSYMIHAITGPNTSKNDRHKNGLSYAKTGEPDAVPFTNWLPAGPDNYELLRGIPLQDKLFAFSEVGGIYVVNRGVPYSVTKLDATATLIAPDSAVAHNNRIFALTTQGVCAISDSGVQVLSFDFEDDLRELLAVADIEVRRYAFGVSYESDRQYQLWLPSAAGDTCCTQAYVYNSLSDTWTHWTGRRTWGAVQPKGNLLHLGDADTNKTRVERKSYDQTDYADEALAVTITNVNAKVITLSSVAGITEGDMLWQSEALKSLIVSVDEEASTVTVLSTESFTAAAASVLVAYECRGLSAALAPGGPAIEKNFQGVHFHFKKFYAREFTVNVDSEKSTVLSTDAIQELGFGLTKFGATPFGSPVNLKNRRIGVDRKHARSTHIRVGFTIREARALWKLHGVSIDHEMVSEKSSR